MKLEDTICYYLIEVQKIYLVELDEHDNLIMVIVMLLLQANNNM